MTLTEFMQKWNGKYLDFDGWYGAQCMDLMHQYHVEVLGIADPRTLAAPTAKDVYVNFPAIHGHDLFEQIGNTPTAVPQEGDIIFWTNEPYGHVAIFIEGDVNSFRSFDQNYPTGSPCHVQNHRYNSVGGWLRYKGQKEGDQVIIDQLRAERDKNWNLYQQERDAKINLETIIDRNNKTIQKLQEDVELLTAARNTLSETIEDLQRKNRTLLDQKNDALKLKEKAELDLEIFKGQRKEITKFTTHELTEELINRFIEGVKIWQRLRK